MLGLWIMIRRRVYEEDEMNEVRWRMVDLRID